MYRANCRNYPFWITTAYGNGRFVFLIFIFPAKMKQEKENAALVPALLCKMLDRHYPSSLPFFPFPFIYSFFFGDPAESVQLASVSGSLTYRSLLVKPLGIKKKAKSARKTNAFFVPFLFERLHSSFFLCSPITTEF